MDQGSAHLHCPVCGTPVQTWTLVRGPEGLSYVLQCHEVTVRGTVTPHATVSAPIKTPQLARWVRDMLIERLVKATREIA